MTLLEQLKAIPKVYGPRQSKIALSLGILLAVGIILTLFAWAYVARIAALEEWKRIAQSLSASVAQQVSQTLRAGDLVLKSVDDRVRQVSLRSPEAIRHEFASKEVFDSIRDRALVAPQVDVATITDADGNVVNFTRSYPPPPINLSDRDYFRVLSKRADIDSFLSMPVQNRGTGTWTFYLAKPIRSQSGEFLGALLTGLHVAYFTNIFSKDAIPPATSISMIRTDGIMIARYPERPEFLGKSFSNQPVFKQIVDIGKLGEAVIADGKRLTSGEDELRIVAPSRVDGFPVIVNVTIGTALALATWRQTVLLVFGLTLPLLLIVLFMTHRTAILLYAQHRALTRVSEEKERADKAGGELVRMSRLSTMQEMSSAIAHELNQPLSATANYLSVATMQLGAAGGLDSMRQAEVLDKAQDQVHRAGEIIRRLRNFISRGKGEEEVVSIDAIVEAAISFSLIRDQYPGLRLSVLLPSRPALYVRVDAIQIQQVLMNLIRNAAEAMSEQSDRRLTVAAKRFTPSHVEVCVRDNGPGMPEQVRSRIFQPFNSGKTDGMGVGLSVCRAIVEAHGGSISVESVAAGGTEFRFTLPAVTV